MAKRSQRDLRSTARRLFGGAPYWSSNLPNMELVYTCAISFRTDPDEAKGDGCMIWMRFPERVPKRVVVRRVQQYHFATYE